MPSALAADHRRGRSASRNFARSRKADAATDEQQQQQQIEAAARTPGGLEARMAGVVVAALKEAFDRDTRRLELERDQLDAERERAERALRLELQRQAGRPRDRPAAAARRRRRRGLAGDAAAPIWPGSRMVATIAARVALGGGWLLLRRGARRVVQRAGTCRRGTRLRRRTRLRRDAVDSGAAGAAALWLIVCGLTLIGWRRSSRRRKNKGNHEDTKSRRQHGR